MKSQNCYLLNIILLCWSMFWECPYPDPGPALTPAILGSLKTSDKESIITLGTRVRFGRGLKRWKAETEGFPTLQTASKTDTSTQSYDRFFVGGF